MEAQKKMLEEASQLAKWLERFTALKSSSVFRNSCIEAVMGLESEFSIFLNL